MIQHYVDVRQMEFVLVFDDVVSFLLIHYKLKVKVDWMVMNDDQIFSHFLMVEDEDRMDRFVIEVNQMHDWY